MHTTTAGFAPGDSHAQKISPQSGQELRAVNVITENAIVADDDRQVFALLKARAGMKGHVLVKVPDGFVLAKGSHSRHCGDMPTVDALLQRMGA